MRFKPHNGKKRRLEHTFSHRKTSSISHRTTGDLRIHKQREICNHDLEGKKSPKGLNFKKIVKKNPIKSTHRTIF